MKMNLELCYFPKDERPGNCLEERTTRNSYFLFFHHSPIPSLSTKTLATVAPNQTAEKPLRKVLCLGTVEERWRK